MTEATNTKLMDTEPGGENTQYESSATFIQPPSKSDGQFSDPNPMQGDEEAEKKKKERAERTVENVRYGEVISEHGFGGETVGNSGEVDIEGQGQGGQMRREQGYGGGSGVGG